MAGRVSLARMSVKRLQELQWEQEQIFAREIMAASEGLVGARRRRWPGVRHDLQNSRRTGRRMPDSRWSWGLTRDTCGWCLSLLRGQGQRGLHQPRCLKWATAAAVLLAEVREHGYRGRRHRGVVDDARAGDRALGRTACGIAAAGRLAARRCRIRSAGQPTLIYWNDVLEHIPPDEVGEYVAHLHRLLAPGGMLVTITPNWLLRPSDVTGDFCPWRTEARGLHLKEYRLAEVTQTAAAGRIPPRGDAAVGDARDGWSRAAEAGAS